MLPKQSISYQLLRELQDELELAWSATGLDSVSALEIGVLV